MAKKTRQENLISKLQKRLDEVDAEILGLTKEEPDNTFDEKIREAIMIREMLRILNDNAL